MLVACAGIIKINVELVLYISSISYRGQLTK